MNGKNVGWDGKRNVGNEKRLVGYREDAKS